MLLLLLEFDIVYKVIVDVLFFFRIWIIFFFNDFIFKFEDLSGN